MAKFSPLMMAPPVIFAGLALLFYVGLQRENPNQLPSALQGQAAPQVVVGPLSDRVLLTDASVREGGVKLLNFWASWCGPPSARIAKGAWHWIGVFTAFRKRT